MTDEMRWMPEWEDTDPCDCGDPFAIKWNPYNQVVQCHRCGHITARPLVTTPNTSPEPVKESGDSVHE